MRPELVLFLDFDGVFHHFFPMRGKTDEENSLFYYTNNIERFCQRVSDHYDLKIVFATSWKERFSFEDLRGFFEDYPSIFNACVDSTPNIPRLPDEGYKWQEASLWLTDNNYSGRYIILDDNPNSWTDRGIVNSNLILCNNKFDTVEEQAAFKYLDIS